MSEISQKVKKRPIFPLFYVQTRDSHKVFLAKRPQVSKLIIHSNESIGSSKYIQFYKYQKRVARITILQLMNSKNLSQLRNIFYNLRELRIFVIVHVQKLFFTFFKKLQFLIIKTNKAPLHPKLKRQSMPSLKYMASPDAHFSRMRLGKLAEKMDILDTFVVNVEPFAFMKNLKELSFNFEDNFERNEIKTKIYPKIIQSLKLKKLKIQESVNGISKFRYLDFLQMANKLGFTLDVIISPKRLSLNSKIYYSPSNLYDSMITQGVNSFTFTGTPKISTGNLLDSPALCTNDEQYLAYLNGMMKHFTSFKTDISYEQIQSPGVLSVVYQILDIENSGLNCLTIRMSLNESFYEIMDKIAPKLGKIVQLQLELDITKYVKPGQFQEIEQKLSKIAKPKTLTELTLKTQLGNITNIENLTSFIESIQHLFCIKVFALRLTQTCTSLIFNLLIEKLRNVKNLDLGFQCLFNLNHVGLVDPEDLDITPHLITLSHIIFKKSIQFIYEGTVLSNNVNSFKATIQAAENIIRAKHFTKIVNLQAVTQTGKPLFMA